jgi:ribulose-phosphate 3-epimerase
MLTRSLGHSILAILMRTVKLSASVLSSRILSLREDMEVLRRKKMDYLHLDLMDGHFVRSIGLPLVYVRQLAREQPIPLEVHLMVTDPQDWLPELFDIGVQQITFHYEVQKDVYEIVDTVKKKKVRVGIALRPYTPIDLLEPFLGLIDSVLLMAYPPGGRNQEAIPGFEKRIRRMTDLARTAKEDVVDIAIDGNVNVTNIPVYSLQGANFFVLGSSGLFLPKGDIGSQIDAIRGSLQGNSMKSVSG